jgi:hypothetical protein
MQDDLSPGNKNAVGRVLPFGAGFRPVQNKNNDVFDQTKSGGDSGRLVPSDSGDLSSGQARGRRYRAHRIRQSTPICPSTVQSSPGKWVSSSCRGSEMSEPCLTCRSPWHDGTHFSSRLESSLFRLGSRFSNPPKLGTVLFPPAQASGTELGR